MVGVARDEIRRTGAVGGASRATNGCDHRWALLGQWAPPLWHWLLPTHVTLVIRWLWFVGRRWLGSRLHFSSQVRFGVHTRTVPAVTFGFSPCYGCCSTLLKWFPDRRGLAAGLALTAFGGGAMLGAPLNEKLFSYFQRAPQYLGVYRVSTVHRWMRALDLNDGTQQAL
jgi:hypothetical protein